MPILQNTLFGWLIGGEYTLFETMDRVTCAMFTEDELLESISKFWEIEECPTTKNQFTAIEQKCEDLFARTFSKDNHGRFIVRLPFQGDVSELGKSHDIALQRLKSVERRLSKHEALKREYIKFMREYEQLGHMSEIDYSKITGSHYFLPHHAVLKPDSTTTKVRVVFDASAKTSTNTSLNDLLFTGPTIQNYVFTHLLRFRFARYAFTADIEKIYRQVWVNNKDRQYQLILWREDAAQPVKYFQLNTITYGTSCAPFLAVRCLKQLAEDSKHSHPLASAILDNNFYVDDVLTGSNDIKTAIDQLIELRQVLSNAGFNLRKWCSNDQRLLKHIPDKDQEVSLELNQTGRDCVKTMGLVWTPREDIFSLRVEPTIHKKVTKRNALAEISSIFDPLGFLAPITITAKIFLQKLWKLKLDWDAALPQGLDTEWNNFRSGFNLLNAIKVPRHIYGHLNPRNSQFHIFADASEKAYGAVAYVRTIGRNNEIIIRLLCAKSKVAPTKQVTLPRLELCAAKLAVDLMQRIQKDLNVEMKHFHLWSDSTAVLGWIKAESANFHTFVANRIASIQRATTFNQWSHVPSQENPADIISRGLTPSQLVDNIYWFYGPRFLHSTTVHWTNQTKDIEECNLEKRDKCKVVMTSNIIEDDVFSEIKHNNSFRRLQRIVAYLVRWRKPKTPGASLLGKANLVVRPGEMQDAKLRIVKYIQASEFSEQIKHIKKYNALQHNDSLAHLSPFLDNHNILRVGGRLEAADISYDAKHPMLLSHKHELVKLLLTDIHRENMHAGAQTLLAICRQQFWVVNGKTLTRNIIHNCVRCTKAKPKLAEQIMGHLPKDRVTASRPFFITGVDFFGPIQVHFKLRGKRPQKAYAAVFCCFSTKAVHLEIVSDLTTDAFIGALRRFFGRRGRCQKMNCDNATNFAGASNQLKEIANTIHTPEAQTQILTMCSKHNVQFCFIPPRAPHFGGLWEAAVKSAKSLLKSTLHAASLTYEEMETLLIEAEAILNSRPLTAMSTDPNDLTALTPGHFLIGEPLTASIDPELVPMKSSGLTRWNLVRHLKNDFWRRWSQEYLSGLQHRYKWNQNCANLKKGTMVIIKDDNLPPQKWALGRIIDVIPGNDGKIRVANVRTASNVSRRPIHKLAPLPVQDENGLDNLESSLMQPTNNSKVSKKDTPNSTGPTTRKRRSSTSLATLLLTCLILPLAKASSVNVTTFKTEPGIYFERIGMTNIISSTWTLVNFLDVRPLHTELQLTKKYVNALSNTCAALQNSTCQRTVQQLQHRFRIVEDTNYLLKAKHRTKRGAFNIIGNIANGLFGVLDSEYAENMASTMDAIRRNEETLQEHAENQTTYIDQTLTMMKRNQEDVEREFKSLEKTLNQMFIYQNTLHRQIDEQRASTLFNEIALQAFLQISHLENMQEAIIDVITDAHHGKINAELLSPKELKERLGSITKLTTGMIKLPLSIDDIAQYYRIMSIIPQITENFIVFSIQIPLILTTQYELLKLTAVPWYKDNSFRQLMLSTPYMIIDLLRDHYFAFNHYELEQCLSIDDSLFFCPQLQPLNNHNSSVGICELQILRESKITTYCKSTEIENVPHWKHLHEPNAWIFSVGDGDTLNIVCNNSPSQLEIKNSGILKIGDECIVRTRQITLEGHTSIKNNRQIVYIPSCNISEFHDNQQQQQSLTNYATLYHSHQSEINTLKEDINHFKTISLKTLRPHDIHHYGLGYTTLTILIALLIVCSIVFYKYGGTIVTKLPQAAPRQQGIYRISSNDSDSHIITIPNN